MFHPYLSSAGVIAPFVHSGARGNLFGISHFHDRADVARAVYEGVGRAILDCYRATGQPLQSVVLAGGGSRSDFWCQLLADMLGVPVDAPEDDELGARGAAIVAVSATQAALGLGEGTAAWSLRARHFVPRPPDPQDEARFSLFCDIASHLGDSWSASHALSVEGSE